MKTTLPPKIGLLSGVGPLAGLDVLAKIYENAAKMYGAVNDADYPDLHLLNHGILGVDNSGALNDNFEAEIATGVYQLEDVGADVIGIACNTAHVYLDKIKPKPETKIINLIDKVSYAASKVNQEYLLLTSRTSKQQQLYHSYLHKYNVIFHETSEEQQELLDKAIDHIMAHELDAAGKVMDVIFDSSEVQNRDAIIAGCTELPIAINYARQTHTKPLIDSNDELAKELLKVYYGR